MKSQEPVETGRRDLLFPGNSAGMPQHAQEAPRGDSPNDSGFSRKALEHASHHSIHLRAC